jgi:serine/threonine protein kinase
MFEKDSLINDQYKVIKLLGKGNMAETYLASDTDGESVVIKVVRLKGLENWKILELFDREAKILKKISHPNVPKYIDYFTSETENDIIYFLVYEYIEGKSLRHLIEEHGVIFTYDQVKDIILKVLNILDYLHNLIPPVIHRDINPNNLIMKDDGSVFVVDFGAVKDKIIRKTSLGGSTFIGTHGYIPLEQMAGRASSASDIFALGMTSITLLTGENPFHFNTKELKPEYKKKKEFNHIDYVIDRMIEPSEDERIKTAKDVIDLLTDEDKANTLMRGQNQSLLRRIDWSTAKQMTKLPTGVLSIPFSIIGIVFLITTIIMLINIGFEDFVAFIVFPILGVVFSAVGFGSLYYTLKRISKHNYIKKHGLETEAGVKFLERDYSIKVNGRPIYFVCGYTFTDDKGNIHYKKVNYLHEDKVMELDIRPMDTIKIKYLPDSPNDSIISDML